MNLIDGERRGADYSYVGKARRQDFLECELSVPIMIRSVDPRRRIMNSNDSARFQKGQPAFVGRARAATGLIAIQQEQVDRRTPSRRDLVGAALVHVHPVSETGSCDVLLEALPKRPSPHGC